MTREITSHVVNPANDKLKVDVLDEPGHGGACHSYLVSGFDTSTNPSDSAAEIGMEMTHILFQNGPINEVGVNGITHEVLLAVLIDRLDGFQSGPYACNENFLALQYLYAARNALHSRTKERMDRGVEGTHQP